MNETPYTDLDRPPLRAAGLARGLVRPGGLWRAVDVVAETGSTQADLVAAARTGAPGGTVLVAEAQTAGRGRLDRSWVTPPRAGLTFSVLVRPDVPVARWVWAPLLAGVAVAEAVRTLSQRALSAPVDARLKWPNDVVVGGRKLAGVLAEGVSAGTAGTAAGPAIVLGVGLNVTTNATELPITGATSLAVEGADCTDRDPLLRAVLREFEGRFVAWTGVAGDPARCGLRRSYLALCDTLGRQVRVELPGGDTITGIAQDVDADGRLVVGGRPISAGDVVHVR